MTLFHQHFNSLLPNNISAFICTTKQADTKL